MVRSQEIVNFMTPTPRGDSFRGKGVKVMNLFKQNIFLRIDQTTEYIVIMTKK